MIIPVQLEAEITPDQVEELTFKALNIKEAALEEFVRKNVEVLFPGESETLLIVGQQARNKEGGRADLVAVDGGGNVVLIELKRDVKDIEARREPFESQAIRYAASYALIRTPQDLVRKLFAPYIKQHRHEYEMKQLTPSELASRLLADFLKANQAQTFNQRQRIILIASSFDRQTLSACAWLAKNEIDIKCLRLSPIRYAEQFFFEVEQLVPARSLDQYLIEVAERPEGRKRRPAAEGQITKESLPRMPELFEWGLVSPEDKVYIRGFESESAEMKDQRHVTFQGQTIKYNDWGRKVTGWSGINIYEWAVHVPTGKTLDALRREKMEQVEGERAETAPNDESTTPPGS